MERRRLLMTQQNGGVPFEQVVCIYGDGVAYMDSGIKPNSMTQVFVDANTRDRAHDDDPMTKAIPIGNIFGARISAVNSAFVVAFGSFNSDSDHAFDFSTNYSQNVGYRYGRAQFFNSGAYYRYKLEFTDYQGNTEYDGSVSSYTQFQCPHNALIFATNNNGTPIRISAIRLYALKVWQYGELVRDYVPCVLTANTTLTWDGSEHLAGEVGLWDLVENKFYGNVAGSGEFKVWNK